VPGKPTVFNSHLISMVVFAALVSVMLACLKSDARRDIVRYAVRTFLSMTGAVVLVSWVMRIL
jgi:hypothetical protein